MSVSQCYVFPGTVIVNGLSMASITWDTGTTWAKTGWATRVKPQVGWYVGYVETSNDVWFFATNIETRNEMDLPLRQKLTREALRVKGVIE